MPGIHEELEIHIKAMTQQEKMFFAKYISPSEIKATFIQMKETIAQEAKQRTQSKIASTFNKGYGTGALLNSLSYEIEGNEVKILSTKGYFKILNEGYGPFDMKPGLQGQTVKMRLPGGRVIFRKCGVPNSKSKISNSNKQWEHPGYIGRHVDKQVQEEMEVFITDFVRTTILSLINVAKSRAGGTLTPGNASINDLY